MAKRAQMADGTILEFPDNTPDEVMDRVAKQHAASAPKGTWYDRPAPKPPSMGRNITRGAGMAATSLAEGLGQG